MRNCWAAPATEPISRAVTGRTSDATQPDDAHVGETYPVAGKMRQRIAKREDQRDRDDEGRHRRAQDRDELERPGRPTLP